MFKHLFVAVTLGVPGCSAATPARSSEVRSAPPAAEVKPKAQEETDAEATEAGAAFEPPQLSVARVQDSTEITVVLNKRPGIRAWSGPVAYTAEPFTVTGLAGRKLQERDVLSSGRAFDLNGDGDTKDSFAVACDDGVVTLGGEFRLPPVMAGSGNTRTWSYRDADGNLRQDQLTATGVSAMLYLPCADGQSVTIGWGPKPLELREIAGPAMMVLAFGDAKTPPTLSKTAVSREPASEGLVEQPFSLEAFEQVADTPKWYAIAGTMVQLDGRAAQQTVRVVVQGDVEHVVIAINEGRTGVERARTHTTAQAVQSRE
ncbi:MAG: hypothetical protein JKY37_11645 [Nannocystaceae bacterium]|nr:hypothetical protein [Nannocystaceae bacterium]